MDSTSPETVAAPAAETPPPVPAASPPTFIQNVEEAFGTFADKAEAELKKDVAAVESAASELIGVVDRRWPQFVTAWKGWDVRHRIAASVAALFLVSGTIWFSHAIGHGFMNFYHSSRNFVAGDTVSHDEMKAGDAATLKDAKKYAASADDLKAVSKDVQALKAQASDAGDVRAEIDALRKQLVAQKSEAAKPKPSRVKTGSVTPRKRAPKAQPSWWDALTQ